MLVDVYPMQDEELEAVYRDLVFCCRQPGMLRISKQACAHRYLLAQRQKETIPDDELGMARKAGLEICRNCPEGRLYAKGPKKGAAEGPG